MGGCDFCYSQRVSRRIYSSSLVLRRASSFHFIARLTARSHPWYLASRSSFETEGSKLSTPAVLTALSVSGFSRSQPKRPSVAPARRADPRAVDLKRKEAYISKEHQRESN